MDFIKRLFCIHEYRLGLAVSFLITNYVIKSNFGQKEPYKCVKCGKVKFFKVNDIATVNKGDL